MFASIQRAFGFTRDEDHDRLMSGRLRLLAHEWGSVIGLTECQVNEVFDNVRARSHGRVKGDELRQRLNVRAYSLNPDSWKSYAE